MINVLADILLGLVITIGIMMAIRVLIGVTKGMIKSIVGGKSWNIKKPKKNLIVINFSRYEAKHRSKKY